MLTETEINELYKNNDPHMELGGQKEWVELGTPERSLEEMRESEKRWKERHLRSDAIAEAKTEKGKEYLSGLWKDEGTKQELSEDDIFQNAMFMIGEPDQYVQAMDYNMAKRLFYDIYCAIVRKTKIEVLPPDENMKAIFPELVKWAIFEPSCKYDLKKGLCLIGFVGVGKTIIMETINTFVTAARIEKRQFEMVDCDELVKEYRKGKDIEIGKSTCFDDLGREPLTSNSYGNIDSVMVTAIQKANSMWCDGLGTFHFTTNDTEKELEAKYGTRAFSRLKQMVNFITIKGESKR